MKQIFLLSDLRCYRNSNSFSSNKDRKLRRSFSIYELDDFCVDVKCKNLLEDKIVKDFVLCCRIFNSLYEEVCVDFLELKLFCGEEKVISFNFNLSCLTKYQNAKDLFIVCSGYSFKAIATGVWKKDGKLTIDKTITIASALKLYNSPLDYDSYLEIEESVVGYAHELSTDEQIRGLKNYNFLNDYVCFLSSFHLLFKAKRSIKSYDFFFLILLLDEHDGLVLIEECQLKRQRSVVGDIYDYYTLSDTKNLSALLPGKYKIEVEYLGNIVFQRSIVLGRNKDFN
jgi:hypothetical protein